MPAVLVSLLVLGSAAVADDGAGPAAPAIAPGSTTATAGHPDHSRRAVTLRMRIHPHGQTTTYQFEFGATPTYGTIVPAATADIDGGDTWVLVQQTIEDLEPHATYHYRLVASNASGTTTGPDQIVQTGLGLPDDRAYELVSPLDKKGSDIMATSPRTRAAGDGDAVQYTSLGVFADAHGTGVATEYMARRTPAGWRSHSLTPLQELQSFSDYVVTGVDPRYQAELSDDLSTGIFLSKTALAGPPNVPAIFHLFRRANLLQPGEGTYELLTDGAITSAPTSYAPWLAGASDDFTHIVFSANARLTADTPDCGACPRRVYEWVQGEGVRLVGILPDSEGGGPAPQSFAGRQSNDFANYPYDPVSRDGRRIFFTVGAEPFAQAGDIYMREDGATTVKLTVSERTVVPDEHLPAKFWGSSADGSKAFFASDEQLTNAAGSGLYRWDGDAPPGARLTLITVDEEASDLAAAPDPRVLGVSEDGSYVYFLEPNQLVDGGEAALPGQSFVYLWHDGALKVIGTVESATDELPNTAQTWSLTLKQSRVTPSGDLLFVSRSDTGLLDQEGGSCELGRCAHVYLYRPTANDGAGQLSCASCPPDGSPADADAGVAFEVGIGGSSSSGHLHRIVTDDGSRVFFATPVALVPEDRNGARHDVYMYDAVNGQLSLISAGTGESHAYLMDVSRSGDDVFFVTREPLVGWDTDENVDLYDARVGGGFPEPLPGAAPCLDDACQSPAGGRPGASAPASSTFDRGRRGVVGRAGFHAHALRRTQLRRLARGLAIRLAVDVSERGRVGVRAYGRLNRGTRLLDASSKVARRGGTARLRLRLPGAALDHLRRHGRLRLKIVVRFSPATRVQRDVVTLVAVGRGRVR